MSKIYILTKDKDASQTDLCAEYTRITDTELHLELDSSGRMSFPESTAQQLGDGPLHEAILAEAVRDQIAYNIENDIDTVVMTYSIIVETAIRAEIKKHEFCNGTIKTLTEDGFKESKINSQGGIDNCPNGCFDTLDELLSELIY